MGVIIQPAAGSLVEILSPAHSANILFPREHFVAWAPGQDRRHSRLDTGILGVGVGQSTTTHN